MTIWHLTADAPRTPRRVSPGQLVELVIGTWPIELGQSVWVTWERTRVDGTRDGGRNAATWCRNTDVNSYWSTRIGGFRQGDEVTYVAHGSAGSLSVQTQPFTFRVRPALYLAFLWHHHQPLYRDPVARRTTGSYVHPWLRLQMIAEQYRILRAIVPLHRELQR